MSTRLENLAAPEPDGSAAGIWPTTAQRLPSGELAIGGVSTARLAREFGTPLYVVDEEDMRRRARAWKEAMDQAFADLAGGHAFYAGKAFLCGAVARWMADEGLFIDTCSEAELRTALAVGIPGERIGLHGNNKSRAEIELALDAAVAHLVVDSLAELAQVEAIAAERGTTAKVMLRVTTGVHAGGHEYIATAHEDQKFGLSIASGAARRAIEETLAANHLRLIGLHSHIGSQILSREAFTTAARAVLALRATAVRELGCAIQEIDFGGGYAVRYTVLDDVPPAVFDYAEALAATVRADAAATGIPAPLVSVEPGRSIAAPAGITLYTVGTIKSVALENGTRRYVSVDGGMSDNIRPALYGADYTATLASRVPAADGVRTRVVGKHCESGDIVVHDVSLSADLGPGDLVAVPVTGAYGRSMASNYNLLPRPGVVAVRDGEARWVLRPESISDLLELDVEASGA
ncbi:diaminopimelate decarboxylase [Actinobaculum sp. 352]|uniref:diaminopimelate decarboxylase n=1 Tax=Actinobaculum sp. 352 TaxID=2490946 RepID=UPI000F7F4C44|nr:diaminopimelate decarboxylase [Actinobaculum sp. 352]RTE49015.1 diaminopimelate decarboxylase [Actinobaculum sp. 352]